MKKHIQLRRQKDDTVLIYIKGILFWKKLIRHKFETIYKALEFLTELNGAPLFSKDSKYLIETKDYTLVFADSKFEALPIKSFD